MTTSAGISASIIWFTDCAENKKFVAPCSIDLDLDKVIEEGGPSQKSVSSKCTVIFFLCELVTSALVSIAPSIVHRLAPKTLEFSSPGPRAEVLELVHGGKCVGKLTINVKITA